MKTVKIPSNMNPYDVWINGLKYSFPAGETVEVEDFIAEAIENSKFDPKPAPVRGILWEDISDKPFGEVFTTLYEGTDLTPVLADGMYTYIIDAGIFAIEVGQTYTVVFEGVTYECVAKSFGSMPTLGNLGLFGDVDTGEPFLCIDQTSFGMGIGVLSSATFSSVKISGWAITKLSEKYRPTLPIFYVDGNVDGKNPYLYTDSSMTKKVTMAELVAAARNGLMISLGGVVFYAPTYVNVHPSELHGSVVIAQSYDSTAGTLSYYEYFTAEYTG